MDEKRGSGRTQVSRLVQELDTDLEAWRHRPLAAFPYVILDARYEKVRYGGSVRDLAVLWAVGISTTGHREVLGVSVSLSEAEVHWRAFLKSLKERGLHGTLLITSDAHEGLKAARKAIFGSTPWQRCQYHLAQNAQHLATSLNDKRALGHQLRDVFAAADRETADQRLKQLVRLYQENNPKLSSWLEENVPEGLTVFTVPPAHQRRLRTSNVMERGNREIKRRTRVATLFPNEDSCLRLVSAVLIEIHEEWVTGKRYLTMTDDNPKTQNQKRKEAA